MDAFWTDKGVLLMEVSSIQGCPYRGAPLHIHSLVINAVAYRELSGGGDSMGEYTQSHWQYNA